jgi:hypothetical protein
MQRPGTPAGEPATNNTPPLLRSTLTGVTQIDME